MSSGGRGLGSGGRNGIIVALAALWVVGLVGGGFYMLRYEKTPGQMESAPGRWPKDVPEVGDAGLPTLVVALHPRCSCSGASLAELEKATENFGQPFNAMLLVYQPKDGGGDWQNNELYRTAQKILHAQAVMDTEGNLASRFGARTSGEVILYSAQDRAHRRSLLYSGGVTGARGMNGSNAGADALVRAFHEQHEQTAQAVYGCGLFSLGSDSTTDSAAVQAARIGKAR